MKYTIDNNLSNVNGKKIICWGIGKLFSVYFEKMSELGITKNIIALVDTGEHKVGTKVVIEEKEFGQFLDFCGMTYFLNCD